MTKEEERISEQAVSIATELFRTRHEMAMAKFGGPHYKDLRKRMARLLKQRDSLKRKLEGKK